MKMKLGQGSGLLYGDPGPAREPVPWPRGPERSGRLVALRPWREDGNWEFGWIGSAITLTVIPPYRGGDPAVLWHRHRGGRPRTDLILTEQDATYHRHVSWDEVPEGIKEIVLGLDTRRPDVRNGTNSRPLSPN